MENKEIKVNENLIKKGELEIDKKEIIEQGITRVFEDGFKELYDNCNPRDHKKLYFFIQILPYINIYHNVACLNPLEENPNEVETLDWKELMQILGIEQKQSYKVKKYLLSLKIKGEHAVMIVVHGAEQRQGVTVNPRIYFKGNDIRAMKGLANVFLTMDRK